MKSFLMKLFLLFLNSQNILGFEYNFITSDGSIHSKSTNGSLNVPGETVALIIYQNNINKTGWANLELTTFDGFPDNDQSYTAGYLEGYVTGDLINMSYENRIHSLCQKKRIFCQKLKKFLQINDEFIRKMIEENKNSDYWHQIDLVYKQLEGMQSGYHSWKANNHLNTTTDYFSNKEIFLLNIGSELSTLENILTPESSSPYSGHCSAIVKPLADGSDLFVAHNTWSDYDSMLRIIKKYSFQFKTNKTKPIPGHSVAFPSYPGVIFSSDDYYVLSSGLVVQETTIHSHDLSLFETIKPENLVLEFIRNIIANRLANSGQQWTQLFHLYNSGTYNNQFMIIDYKLFKNGTKLSDLPNNLLWIIEQMPGLTKAADVTPTLRTQGYWASYNVPFLSTISTISRFDKLCLENSTYYCWNLTARARIFRREEPKVTDLKTLYSLMRFNDFKRDPLSQCKLYNQTCSPPYSSELTIAARNDLNDPKGKYPIYQMSHRGEGAIDAKLVNSQMVTKMEMIAVSGPTNRQPLFQWSKSDLKLKHWGHPDTFNFKPIAAKWYPLSYQTLNDFD